MAPTRSTGRRGAPDYLTRPEIPLDDRTAAHWDELSLWASRFGALMLDRIPLEPGLRVLDLACGAGFPALEIGARLGAGSLVIGLDRWVGAVRRAEEKRRFQELEQMWFVAGDGARLPFPDHAFDLVTSNLGINNFTDASGAFTEAARVLRPGGHVALTTNILGHMDEFYDAFRAVLDELGDVSARERLEHHVLHRGTAGSIGAALERAGFTVQETASESFAMRFASALALFRHPLVRIGFLPEWREVAGATLETDVFERLERRLDAGAERGRGITTTVPMLFVLARR